MHKENAEGSRGSPGKCSGNGSAHACEGTTPKARGNHIKSQKELHPERTRHGSSTSQTGQPRSSQGRWQSPQGLALALTSGLCPRESVTLTFGNSTPRMTGSSELSVWVWFVMSSPHPLGAAPPCSSGAPQAEEPRA